MSIATYAELQTAVAAWLNRTDLTAVIPDCIKLAEVRIKTLTNARQVEAEATLACAVGSATIALPSDYKAPVALWLTDVDPREQLPQLLPQNLPTSTSNGRPQYWAIDAANVRFDCPADSTYAVALRYKQTLALSNATTTNAILTDYPDVYLFGALVEAAAYCMDERAVAWDTRFQSAVQAMNNLEAANTKHVALRSDFVASSFDINRGY